MNKTSFIYGTLNPAKLKVMEDFLEPINIEIVGLKSLGMTFPDVDESGSSPLENARIKALAYYNILKSPVFACDSGLYIEGLSEDEQPGVHIRRVNNKRMDDEQMIDYYTAVAAKLGGKAPAQYRNAICLVMSENEIYEDFSEDLFGEAFFITDKPHAKRVQGFPLDSISVHIKSGEYYYERPDDVASTVGDGVRRFFTNLQKNLIL